MKATIAAQGLREQAERRRKPADAIESEPTRPPDPMKPIGSSHSTELPPPQWAADPHGEHRPRWWDGATCTDQTAD